MNERTERHKPPFDIGLLLIERKSDLIAFVALILSSLSLIVALYLFLKKPDPRLLVPKTVIFAGLSEGKGQPRSLSISTPMSYVNMGEKDQPWIAVDEYVRFSLPGSNHRYVHHSSGYGELLRIGNLLESVSEKKQQAFPFKVGGSDVLAHVTQFSPKRGLPPVNAGRDFLSLRDFSSALMKTWREETQNQPFEQSRLQHTVPLTLEFCAKGLDGTNIGTRCTVYLYYDDLWNLASNMERTLKNSGSDKVLGQGWSVVTCFSDDSSVKNICK